MAFNFKEFKQLNEDRSICSTGVADGVVDTRYERSRGRYVTKFVKNGKSVGEDVITKSKKTALFNHAATVNRLKKDAEKG